MNELLPLHALCELGALVLLTALMVTSRVLRHKARSTDGARAETLWTQEALAAAGADLGLVAFLLLCQYIYPSNRPLLEALLFPISAGYYLGTSGALNLYRWRRITAPWVLDLAHNASGLVPGLYILATWIPVSIAMKVFACVLMAFSGLAIVGFLHSRSAAAGEESAPGSA